MNQNDLINEYINQLSNQYKQLVLDEVMLKTQITLLSKQVEELTKKVEELEGLTKEKKKKPDASPSDFSN
jgi:cell division septum initiation protein DivIVA